MVGHPVQFALALGLLSSVVLIHDVQAANPLNGTGIDFYRDHAAGADTPISATTSCQPLPTHGGQDARYGQDAAAAKGELTGVY